MKLRCVERTLHANRDIPSEAGSRQLGSVAELGNGDNEGVELTSAFCLKEIERAVCWRVAPSRVCTVVNVLYMFLNFACVDAR